MNLDDPKLTAYALGEISDAGELAEIEIWLAGHAEGQTYVAETRELAAFLADRLQAARPLELTAEQRAALLQSPSENERLVPFSSGPGEQGNHRRRAWTIIGLTALAACLAAAPLLPWAALLQLRDRSAPTLAINEKPMALPLPQAAEEAQKNASALKLSDADQLPAPSALPAWDKNEMEEAKSALAEAQVAAGESVSSAPIASEPLAAMVTSGAPAAASVTARLAPQAQMGLQQKLNNELAGSGRGAAMGGAGGVSRDRSLPDSPAAADFYAAADVVSRQAKLSGGAPADDLQETDADQRRVFSFRANRTENSASLGNDKNKRLLETEPANTEAYDSITENSFLQAKENPLSTFSIDVDTASYANIRRFLNSGQLPPKGAVRIEEMLNYFPYDYAKPADDAPFSTNLEVADCPWQPDHRLVRIGLRGKEAPATERKAANLVFLIDVSGSMDEANKLPLLKQSLRLLIDQLGENDRVAIAVYAGQSGLVLPSTTNKVAIRDALDNLTPGGSTNGASGIRLAYAQAVANFQKEGVNRVILATDGDFNVGVTNQSDLLDLITDRAKTGVFLSVLGFGTGNVKDSTMEKLADKGNGNYAYIDSLKEGRKVLVEQMGGTLVTIAKDVKIQVEFNPAVVSSYRLIGYENRALKKEDFNDDQKDAGEIGAGHTVTALYEIAPVGSLSPVVATEPLKYSNIMQAPVLPSGDLLTVKLRYKEPAGEVSKKLEFPLKDTGRKLASASQDFQFASAVAEFGQLLRQSEHRQLASWDAAIARAEAAKGEDRGGYRAEFVELVKRAKELSRQNES